MAWWHVAAKFKREIDSSVYLRAWLLLGMLWGPTAWPSEANLARGPLCPFWAVSLLTYHSPFWASVSLSDNEEQFSYLLVVFRTQAVQGKHLAQCLSRGENSLSGGYFCHHSLLQPVLLRTGQLNAKPLLHFPRSSSGAAAWEEQCLGGGYPLQSGPCPGSHLVNQGT